MSEIVAVAMGTRVSGDDNIRTDGGKNDKIDNFIAGSNTDSN